MRKNKLANFLKGISMALLLTLINESAHAQCQFVQKQPDGSIISINLPCDFPVFNLASASDVEKNAFKKTVADWKLKNPGFDALSFTPKSTQEYFEITKSDFEAFSSERKKIISALPFFYKVK